MNSKEQQKFLNAVKNQIKDLEHEVRTFMQSATSVRNTRATEEEVNKHVTHYAEFVYTEVTENLGNCEPIYKVLSSTVHVISYKLGSPIGVYWWSLNFILFLFYPITIIAFMTTRIW